MKILVFSDSHGSIHNMERVLHSISGHIDMVLHLGDGFLDMDIVMSPFPDVPYHRVPGNCDPYDIQSEIPEVMVLNIDSKRFLMTHGHMYDARSGIHRLSLLAEEHCADVCLFGHTHKPCVFSGDMLIVNPGSISRPRGSKYPSYGVIDIDHDGAVSVSVVEVQPDGFRVIL